MANQKISDLRSLNLDTVSNEDLIPIVDVSENTSPTGELKKISVNQFTIALSNRVGAGIDEKINSFTSTNFIPLTQVGVANGVTPLNSVNKIDDIFINFPAGAVSSIFGRGGVVSASVSDYSSFYVSKAGDTVSGPLIIPINPTLPSQSVSKQYTDNISSSLSLTITSVSSSTNLYITNVSASITNRITVDSSSFSSNLTNLSSSVISISSSTASRINTKQDILGFFPVQQGGGIGQSSNKVYLGVSGSRLTATIDSTNLGSIVFDSNLISTDSILKFPEKSSNGNYFEDKFGYVDAELNPRVIGAPTNNNFGGHYVYTPAATLFLPLGQKCSKFVLTQQNCFALSTAGYLFAMGRNNVGQCGIGNTTDNISQWIQCVGLPTNIASIVVCGSSDPYEFGVITTDGKLYLWGYNIRGQVGNGNTSVVTTPYLTAGPGSSGPQSPVLQCVANGGGGVGTFVIRLTDGTVWCTGYGGLGQMGRGNTTDANSTWQQVQTSVGVPLGNITKIGIGGYQPYTTLFALRSDGFMFGWGYGSEGSIGVNSSANQLFAVNMTGFSTVTDFWCTTTAGASIFVKASGNIYACGYNGVGQLGLGDTTNRLLLTNVASLNGYNVTNIYSSAYPDPYQHCIAVVSGNSQVQILGTGNNDQGQLGLGDTTQRQSFTAIPFYQTSGIADLIAERHVYGGRTGVITNDGNFYFCGISRWGMASSSDQNLVKFKKITRYING